ncbi:hypothetical protein D3C80_1256390 [compost metagenome]
MAIAFFVPDDGDQQIGNRETGIHKPFPFLQREVLAVSRAVIGILPIVLVTPHFHVGTLVDFDIDCAVDRNKGSPDIRRKTERRHFLDRLTFIRMPLAEIVMPDGLRRELASLHRRRRLHRRSETRDGQNETCLQQFDEMGHVRLLTT